MSPFEFHAPTLAHTDQLGAALAAVLPAATTVALGGTLGAGKTRLVQAIAAGFNVPRSEVVSPTYVLCHEYEGRLPIYHLDVYRLCDDDEFLELGPEEYFESAAITLIEWADRVVDCLPRDRLEIDIQITGTSQRRFEITATGTRAEAILEALRAKLKVTE
ncbi:MAG: tRNA (adenosine(37)-N6)-threonylcarbamoyltransferase complex ATPase subunit type 1 TsaE [Pirellulaceae bacterium]|jgi:tRNA threonylcarbamoyladenosine biosynthesis protein TsaE|nr:tRNA (adenosine(37)-N6)-threonylcarbamoyltransferase complex ATPase subunit type 1 TsaE [Pirellulaceae bacterium]MDP7305489.1 tRNA (adenosine(37)-N6)-threonylcarbamoyltransferase complex ATPase subunit type 1 TsaE [Pirellulaceae bacterium]HJN10852.1 tRNA (adenosine(37)-N6)-threonylcarbamoyltransferase complex ATPase subunit type 1 TsaE [Pirellulaceae bacterium]